MEQDFGEKRRIRARMYKLREKRLKEFYTSDDVIGIQLGGALKNIYAIAAGVCDGFGMGDNAKAALITRGIVEMARFGQAHGAQASTFFGLAGLGDLVVTGPTLTNVNDFRAILVE